MIFTLVQPLVRSVIRTQLLKGFSRNAVWRQLPTFGLPKFHKQTYWKHATQILGEISKEPLVKAFPADVPLDHTIMVEGDIPTVNKYWLKGEVTYYDPEIDEMITKRMSFFSDANLGKEGWIKQFINRYTPPYSQEELEIIDADIDLVIHQKDFPY